jgi:hypothetical protein
MKQRFAIGTCVSWTFCGRVSSATYHGRIADVIRPGARPNTEMFPTLKDQPSRDHVSYVVRVGTRVCWPPAELLVLA